MVTKLFRNPRALSSVLAVLGALQPWALGFLNSLVTLVLASNYCLVYYLGLCSCTPCAVSAIWLSYTVIKPKFKYSLPVAHDGHVTKASSLCYCYQSMYNYMHALMIRGWWSRSRLCDSTSPKVVDQQAYLGVIIHS